MRLLSVVGLLLVAVSSGQLGAQVDPEEVRAAYQQGSLFLDQGLYEAARREFAKVLHAIPPQQRPSVLQLTARCFFLQDNMDAAVLALKRAVLLAPGSDISRQLLIRTLETVGKGEEADSWLDRLATDGPVVLGKELGADLPKEEMLFLEASVATPPPLTPTAHRTGAFRIVFDERSPLSSAQIYQSRYGTSREEMSELDPAAGDYELGNESYEVFVPDNYGSEEPFGLVVWISPADGGGISRPDNLEALSDERILWIGANKSGNDRYNWYRVGLALDAAHNMQQLYNIDPDRIYVAGYSGGGRVASSMAILYPEVFQGGAYFFGCGYLRGVPVPRRTDAEWPASFPPPPQPDLAETKKRNRYVLLTGKDDFNRLETKANSRAMRRDGFEHVTYLEIPDAAHGYGVRGDWLRRVIEALDKPLESD